MLLKTVCSTVLEVHQQSEASYILSKLHSKYQTAVKLSMYVYLRFLSCSNIERKHYYANKY